MAFIAVLCQFSVGLQPDAQVLTLASELTECLYPLEGTHIFPKLLGEQLRIRRLLEQIGSTVISAPERSNRLLDHVDTAIGPNARGKRKPQ